MQEENKTERSIPSTEEQIKAAARRVFTRKGYAATRTRDIAEESGHNLALLNYYFRSKEKLFNIIMMEHLHLFIKDVLGIVNDESTTLPQKLELLVAHYIDMLLANPGVPVFMLHIINTNPDELLNNVASALDTEQLVLVKQWRQFAAAGNVTLKPAHIIMNLLGLTIFPFIASPMIKRKLHVSDQEFIALMTERKQLVPVWMKAILASS
ncbi:MAG: TetR/AcrR family transcriptional regulator [Taibaiella sp.]|nr:TetR/AcrR family transcriptional regulator [Taibaiella sp.]